MLIIPLWGNSLCFFFNMGKLRRLWKLNSNHFKFRTLLFLIFKFLEHILELVIQQSFITFSFSFFKLVDNCFTMLCWSLLYNNMNQPLVYRYFLPLELPSQTPAHFHPTQSRLSQTTGLRFLCYIAASHWLSILYTVEYTSVVLSRFFPPFASKKKKKKMLKFSKPGFNSTWPMRV